MCARAGLRGVAFLLLQRESNRKMRMNRIEGRKMAQLCKVCSSEHRAEIEAAMGVGATLSTISTLFGVTEASAGRHKRDHLARTETKLAGDHLEAADRMIATARAARPFDAYDEAECLYLRAVAAAVDARSDNPSLLHEYRVTLSSFRPEKPQQAPQDAQLELAELIASLTGPPPDAWQRAFDSAVAAGVPPDKAGNVASAATDRNYDPHPPQTPGEWHARKKSVAAAIDGYRRTGHYERKD
jgi:hypothetical protein